MKFALAVAIAMSFWGDRGVQVPCQPVPVAGADAQLPVVDQWGNIANMAAASGCRILLQGGVRIDRTRMPEMYCAHVVHEVGHLAGVGHNQSGLMAEHGPFWEDIPLQCVQWKRSARRLGFSAKDARRLSGA